MYSRILATLIFIATSTFAHASSPAPVDDINRDICRLFPSMLMTSETRTTATELIAFIPKDMDRTAQLMLCQTVQAFAPDVRLIAMPKLVSIFQGMSALEAGLVKGLFGERTGAAKAAFLNVATSVKLVEATPMQRRWFMDILALVPQEMQESIGPELFNEIKPLTHEPALALMHMTIKANSKPQPAPTVDFWGVS